MMSRVRSFVLLVTCLTASASAQTPNVSGIVIDDRTGEPLRSALIDGRPLFYGLSDQRNTLRLPTYSRLDVRADRAFNWSGRRLVLFVDVANIANRKNLRNVPPFVDRGGRVLGATESLMPIVPSGGFVIEF